jgi:DNA-binding transcriptional LysR family regulator
MRLQTTRAMLRGHATAAQDVIEFAVPHTLAFTFFPAWVSNLREQFGPIKSRLIALNVHDAVMRLVEGSCDLLISLSPCVSALPAGCRTLRNGESG